jgi:hypothetical protein
MQKARIAGRAHWLVIKHLSSRMDVFTTHLCGDPKALVVFSFQEEAEMFLELRLTASKDGWRVRQTSVGELVSVLYGPCSDTKKVVLDPLPEIGREELTGPLGMHRAEFLRFLLGKKDLRAPTPRPIPDPQASRADEASSARRRRTVCGWGDVQCSRLRKLEAAYYYLGTLGVGARLTVVMLTTDL